jgi:hypothetical protein
MNVCVNTVHKRDSDYEEEEEEDDDNNNNNTISCPRHERQ